MKDYRQWKENSIPLQNDPKHMIGNPLFAIETNLAPLRKRIVEKREAEALQILDEIQLSINKIKEFLSTLD